MERVDLNTNSKSKPKGKVGDNNLIVLLVLIGGVVLMSIGSSVDYSFIDADQFENITIMTNVTSSVASDYYLDVSRGLVDGASLIHKFGATTLDTSIHPVAYSEHYRTPQTAVSLEFVSSDVDDTLLGDGAREITIIGLDNNWDEVVQVINTNGTTPVIIPINLSRLYRWYVSKSGTYATESLGSHEGTLTIQGVGSGDLWSTIPINPFPIGQSQIGVVSIPRGKTAYLLKKTIFVDSSKTADVYFFKREYVNDTDAPYDGAMRLVEREVGVTGGYDFTLKSPNRLCSSPCDIGFMGELSVGTAEASVEFEILLLDQ